jgi:hypothetical protein
METNNEDLVLDTHDPSNWKEHFNKLLDAVTGKGSPITPEDLHKAEADRILRDPSIPKSDLRGPQDHHFTGEFADAWHSSPTSDQSTRDQPTHNID